MTRYLEQMSREELVTEVIGLVQAGVVCPHEVFDPTVLPADRLREAVKRLRLRLVIDGRVVPSQAAGGGDAEEGRG